MPPSRRQLPNWEISSSADICTQSNPSTGVNVKVQANLTALASIGKNCSHSIYMLCLGGGLLECGMLKTVWDAPSCDGETGLARVGVFWNVATSCWETY
ncbi:hypothetical protein U1Q18_023084 [Sarracenia purpurea var. burkii]